ncbi:MAG: threonine/homoserine/homoserine lactone efflux protein [Halioglobus sp.]|jgi:threonine/homoserine/homoserine lactone efflux protein
MEFGLWLSLLSICLLGAMSPGPSLAVVLRATLGGGRPAGYAAAISHGVGVALYGLLTITGLAVLITRSPSVFFILQLCAALYLIYLGVNSLRGSAYANPSEQALGSTRDAAVEGFMVAFLNPKLAVFMLALFSQFLHSDFGVREKSIMVATVGITDALWYALVTSLLARESFLAKLRKSAGTIDKVFGLILIALALSVAVNALL